MKGVWVLSASLLLLGVPFALASTEDQQIAMEEKQMQLQASANEVSRSFCVWERGGRDRRRRKKRREGVEGRIFERMKLLTYVYEI